MPSKPAKPCAYPGCPRLVDSGKQYCEEHELEARRSYDKYERSDDVHKRYGRKWTEVRNKYISAHPFCEKCWERGIATLADEVHHIVPVDQDGSDEESNLMSLCRSCHNKIHHEMGSR